MARRIPSGLIVCHRCDVRACINPAHLFLGTVADNMRDLREKERQLARLEPGALEAIRGATGSMREIANRYGIAEGLVCKIKHDHLAAQLRVSKTERWQSRADKLLEAMAKLQSTLQDVLRVLSREQAAAAIAPSCSPSEPG